jgi:hypothetical protein
MRARWHRHHATSALEEERIVIVIRSAGVLSLDVWLAAAQATAMA